MTYLPEEKNKKFIGDGSRNEAGQSLQEFLQNYDPDKYRNPSCTVDTAVFTYSKENKDALKVLLIKRRNHPSIGLWALPGGFVEFDEDIEVTSKRELEEETGVSDVSPVQVGAYGKPDRDPRTRIITTLFAALVPEESIAPKAGDDAKDALLFDIEIQDEDYEFITINFHSEKTDTNLSAKYKKTQINDDFFPQTKYELIDSQGIALDHELLIIDAYMFVKKHI